MLFKKIVLVVFLMALFITTPKNFTIAANNPGEYVMSITSRVFDDSQEIGDVSDILGAFTAATCVGVAEAAANLLC